MGAFVPDVGALVARKFELERPLARGGMGTVWAARHLELGIPVAVKFLEAPDKRNARARFEREARALAALRSPHVVQVLDYGVDRDTPYLVMEFLEGEDLHARLDRDGRLQLAEVANIVRQVALGLDQAHEAGVVHRDIKLSNVFIARIGSREIVKIIDFGVAKAPALSGSADPTMTSELIGSPAYMSPEQARGAPVDSLSDLWSLGIVAYVVLTGRHPFEGENLGDLLVNICTEPFDPATTVRSDLPRAIDRFFARALCRSPDGRYPTASELADALAATVDADDHEPGFAAPHDEPTVDGPRAAPTVDLVRPAEPEPTLPSTVRSERPPEVKSRAWPYLFAGAAAVGLVWLATQSLSEETPATPADASASEQPVETPAAAVTTGEATAPSADASTETVPSASAPVVRPVPRWIPRPRAKPTPTPSASAGVDPKFGLPK